MELACNDQAQKRFVGIEMPGAKKVKKRKEQIKTPFSTKALSMAEAGINTAKATAQTATWRRLASFALAALTVGLAVVQSGSATQQTPMPKYKGWKGKAEKKKLPANDVVFLEVVERIN
jgi:hypothetical protein